MNCKTKLLGFAATLVIAASAHAETPLFTTLGATGVLGASGDWTTVTIADLNAVGPARFSFELVSEQTAAVTTQTFSVNGGIVFAGSDTNGATMSSGTPLTLTSFAFDSNVGGSHAVSTLSGNTPTIDHSGAYQIYHSALSANTFALAYEDDFRTASPTGGDFNDMVVRISVAAVPEPETYALMLAGLGAIGFIALRRRPD